MEGCCALAGVEIIWDSMLFRVSRFIHSFLIICILMGHPDDPVDAPVKDRSKTIKTMIPISKDSTGRPALPSITRSSNLHTKIIQSMLREYCMAHIHE